MAISNTKYAQKAAELLARAEESTIPYVSGGMSLSGMDCQGLCEFLLIECGVSKTECDLAGSNAHYRNCTFRCTPEKCVEMYGEVPVGAWIFIVNNDGGEPAKYANDGLGNASHMGVKISDGVAIHASSSRGCVAESMFLDKTIPNGGWNMVGFPPWIEYESVDDMNFDDDEGILEDDLIFDEDEDSLDDDDVESIEDDEIIYDSLEEAKAAFKKKTTSYAVKKYVVVLSPNEYPVKLREAPQKNAIYKYSVPDGEFLLYQGEKNGFFKVTYNGKTRYLHQDYGVVVKVRA